MALSVYLFIAVASVLCRMVGGIRRRNRAAAGPHRSCRLHVFFVSPPGRCGAADVVRLVVWDARADLVVILFFFYSRLHRSGDSRFDEPIRVPGQLVLALAGQSASVKFSVDW